jgi:DMSO/TMAO reductase YedYZ molybdopterin-dependent catalytic subunit
MVHRRDFLRGLAAAGGGLLLPSIARGAGHDLGPPELPSGSLDTAILDALPGKRALIKKSFRPPNYETPITYFSEAFTPNDAFFVRYHLSNIPRLNAEAWRLAIGGEAVEKPYELTLGRLQSEFEQVEIPALCQCSGNRRGLFQPHVFGVEWGYGAMGNARWGGVRLRDILARAGMKKEALEVTFDGADGPVLEKTPDFVKSLPVWKALDESTLVVYQMNGEPLPHWNGFPVRLVVPGWTATYWVKHLIAVNVVDKPLTNFWMKSAYRIPKGKFPIVDRFVSQETDANTPITEMVVNSLITNPHDHQRFKLGEAVEINGVAWDGGYGIAVVEVSTDGGASWRPAEFGKDYGRFSWRQFNYRFTPAAAGEHVILARAANRSGATQTFSLIANPAGYHHNVVQKIAIVVG